MIRIKIEGFEKFKAAGKKAGDLKKNLPTEFAKILNKFGLSVQRTASKKYLSGPRPEKLGVVTGNLRSSIRFSPASILGDKISLTIGTDVKYAAIHEFGGKTSPHIIEPKRKQWLRFFIGGKAIFAKKVNHPGSVIPKRPFLNPAFQDNLPGLKQDLSDYLQKSIAGIFNV